MIEQSLQTKWKEWSADIAATHGDACHRRAA
jgi:hypothetical protein